MQSPTGSLRLAYLADPRSIHTKRWLHYFVSRGHEVSLLVGMEDRVDPDLDPRIVVHRYPRFGPRRLPLVSSLQGRRALRRLLRALQPDILHSHYVSRYGWQAWLSGFHPYVVTAWGSDLLVTTRRSLRARLLARATLAGADLVTAPSAHLVASAIRLGAPAARTEQVPFGVDIDAFTPAVPSRERLEAVGLAGTRFVFSPRGLAPVYRQQTAVEALHLLPPDVVLVIPGRTAQPDTLVALKRLSRELHLEQRVRVLDDVPQPLMLDLYRGAAVVVSVPESDGLPASVLEAMACGTPVVVSDLPGPREAIGASSRFLVAVGDSAALALKIRDVLDLDPTERLRISRELRSRVEERFSYQASMARMESLYLSVRR